jgi:hypothetical protein
VLHDNGDAVRFGVKGSKQVLVLNLSKRPLGLGFEFSQLMQAVVNIYLAIRIHFMR